MNLVVDLIIDLVIDLVRDQSYCFILWFTIFVVNIKMGRLETLIEINRLENTEEID